MEEFERIVRRASERLYEDEQLRSNLSDDEAQVVLGWAERWMEVQINAADDENRARQIAQAEWSRIRQAIKTINVLAARLGELRLSEAIAEFESSAQNLPVLPRARVFNLVTQYIDILWRSQAEQTMVDSQHPNAPIPD